MATASKMSLDRLRSLAIPRRRNPGATPRKRVVWSEKGWNTALAHLKRSMGAYRVIGFDVECINIGNPKQCGVQRFKDVKQEFAHLGKGDMKKRRDDPPKKSPPRQLHQSQRSSSPALSGSSATEAMDEIEEEISDEEEDSYQPHRPIEWIPVLPSPRRPKRHQEISVMIQMSTLSGLVVILRLCFWRSIPTSLREFLADPQYLKTGVAIDRDASLLLEDWGLNVRGWVDLRCLCTHVAMENPTLMPMKLRLGLKHLAQAVFGTKNTLPLPPGKMRLLAWSDWNAARLSLEQVIYAAWDAQIAVDLFSFFVQRLLNQKHWRPIDKEYFDKIRGICQKEIEQPATCNGAQNSEDEEDYLDDDDVEFWPDGMPMLPGDREFFKFKISDIALDDPAILKVGPIVVN